jgi:hypothetical protein
VPFELVAVAELDCFSRVRRMLLGRLQPREVLARDLDLDSALHLNQVRILLDGLEDGIDASRSHLGELCGAQPDLRRGAFYLFCGEG